MKLLRIAQRSLIFNRRFSSKIKNVIGQKYVEWAEPEGFDTGLIIYNTANKKKVKFKTRQKGIVSWYACGPTVYDSAHVGHACCYMYQDIIRRVLEDVFNLNVVMVMGITDIDDKIIRAASSSNHGIEGVRYLAQRYEKEFVSDLMRLNIRMPTIAARVTDFIPEIINFIGRLIEKGFAYKTDDGSVYFQLDKYAGYGKLHPAETETLDVEEGRGKESVRDFALWKGAKKGEPYWSTPWGNGRPGWHIECSTIASCLLGGELDVHSGGVDLIFPHHENEEAQSCCYHGVDRWVNYWIHTGHLCLAGDVKMSKSLKNTISISEFLQNYSPFQLRMFCLLTRYRNGIEFSSELMENAISICRKFDNFFNDCSTYIRDSKTFGVIDEAILLKSLDETETKVVEALSNDFDTPRAVSHLLHLITLVNKMLHQSNGPTTVWRPPVTGLAVTCNFVKTMLITLGYDAHNPDSEVSELGGLVDSSVQFRAGVRKTALKITNHHPKESLELKKELLSHCDNFRKSMMVEGIELKDHGENTSWNLTDKRKTTL